MRHPNLLCHNKKVIDSHMTVIKTSCFKVGSSRTHTYGVIWLDASIHLCNHSMFLFCHMARAILSLLEQNQNAVSVLFLLLLSTRVCLRANPFVLDPSHQQQVYGSYLCKLMNWCHQFRKTDCWDLNPELWIYHETKSM